MLKYVIYYLLAFSAIAELHYEEGKPYIKVSTGIFPLDVTELTSQSEQRMFEKNLGQEIGIYKSSLRGVQYDLKDQMSEVKQQGQRSTCSVFQVIGLIEQYKNKFGDLSEQCLAYTSSAVDPGDPYSRLHHAKRMGVYAENDCPYVDPSNDPKWLSANEETREQLRQAARHQIPDLSGKTAVSFSGTIVDRDVTDFTAVENLDYVRNKIKRGKPVGISTFVVGNGWENGSIIKVPSDDEIRKFCPGKTLTLSDSPKKFCSSHSVIITGFDDARGVFYFKNSWDEQWGVNRRYFQPAHYESAIGYGVISYEYFSRFTNGKLITLE